MASAVRHIKTKAIQEQKEKQAAKDAERAWYSRSSDSLPTDGGYGAEQAGAATQGDAAAGGRAAEAAEVEVVTTTKPKKEKGGLPYSDHWPRKGLFWRFQPQVRGFYESPRTQMAVAALIMLNFLCNIVEKEVDPQGIHGKPTWRVFEHVFNAIFLLELLINSYGRWLRDFWCDNWNIFDVVVVVVGCISFFQELEGPLKLLRTLRALRVLKLFKRIKSLNKILVMIGSAIPGVSSAFAVMVISISIFALIGVEFFSLFGSLPTQSLIEGADVVAGASPGTLVGSNYTRELLGVPDCSYYNFYYSLVGSVTSREICFGNEYFGTFTRAWYTLFQVLTGESWSEAVARPILYGWNDYGAISVYLSAFFFISFVIINAFILFNVFVAVLLDKVVAPDVEPDDDDDEEHEEGITLYPWADPFHQPHAGAPAAAGATPQKTPMPMPHGTPGHGKPTPAKLMENLTFQLAALMREQQQRSEEANELKVLLRSVVERLDKLERLDESRL